MERQARKRAALDNGSEKVRGREDRRGVVGWRLIFCSLASASSSASGRPHFARAAQLRVERDHPSSCPPFRSRPTLLLFLFFFFIFLPFASRFSIVSDLLRLLHRRSLNTLATMTLVSIETGERREYIH